MNDDVEARYGWLRGQANRLESRARLKERLAEEREDRAPLEWGNHSRYYFESMETAARYREEAKQLRVERQTYVELGRNLRRLYPSLNNRITKNLNNPR